MHSLKTTFLTVAVLLSQTALAQYIPFDAAVRRGTLDNGLTYYVRHHEEPAGTACFYIAQKVGSILEEDDQRGLAHFLEHMCFNGTEHFPGNGVIKYCESIGVKFGADLNAYTSIDETVYNIDNVPVGKVPSAVDSCLLILRDWSAGLLLTEDDIDHERGVIHEEWRSRRGAMSRMLDKILPEIYPGNKYGQRMPIGTMEVVDNFPYKVLRDYYHKWYRPDLQGIIVVGDIDVDVVEAKIKETFGDISAQTAPAERYYVPVGDNAEPIVSIASDKEQPTVDVYVSFKHNDYPDTLKDQMNYMIYRYALSVSEIMISRRLGELKQLPEPPFVDASIDNEEYYLSKTKYAVTAGVTAKEEDVCGGVAAVYRELLRAMRHGFTEGEYDRARAEYLMALESVYNERAKRKSKSFCKEYVRHFLDNEPVPGIENEYSIMKGIAGRVSYQMASMVFRGLLPNCTDNMVVVCMYPEKEGISYPDSAAVMNALNGVAAENIAPYEDKALKEPLTPDLPAPGKVVKTLKPACGYTGYLLSNGARVWLRTTDYNPDEVLMKARSWGGTSLYKDAADVNLKLAGSADLGGLGNFSRTQLTKVLSGKKAGIQMDIDLRSESLTGRSGVKDFETLLQLTHLYFTSIRRDDSAFRSWKKRYKATLLNAEAQPMSAFSDTMTQVLYKYPERLAAVKSSDLDSANYARMLEIARERFAGADDFDFIFTGNMPDSTFIPLIERYIGSLPAAKKKETRTKGVTSFADKGRECFFERRMLTPTAAVLYVSTGNTSCTFKNAMAFNVATQVLTKILLEEIREKKGGTYNISASGSMKGKPDNFAYCQIYYKTSPFKVDDLNAKVDSLVSRYAAEGPTQEQLDEVRKYLFKKHEENLRENAYYQSALLQYLADGIERIDSYESTLKSITVADVKKAFAAVCGKKSRLFKIVMKGVK